MDGLDLRSKRRETHLGSDSDDAARENVCSDVMGTSRVEFTPGSNVPHSTVQRNDLRTYGSFGSEFGNSLFDSFRDLGMPTQQDDYQIGFGLPPNVMQATSAQASSELPQNVSDRNHVEYRLTDVTDEWGLHTKTDWHTESTQDHQTSPSCHDSRFKISSKKCSSKVPQIAGFIVDAENSASAYVSGITHTFASQTEISEVANRSIQRNDQNLCASVKTLQTASYHNIAVEHDRAGLQLNDQSSPFDECLDLLNSNLPVVSESNKEVDGSLESNSSASGQNKLADERLQCFDDRGSENRLAGIVSVTEDCNGGCDNNSNVSMADEVEPAVNHNVPASSVEKNDMLNCLTLDVPLEVIGACWFMRRDSETCLQALTSTNGQLHCYQIF